MAPAGVAVLLVGLKNSSHQQHPHAPAAAAVRSAVQDPGLLLLELGLGQHARRQQLTELLQLGEPVTRVGWLRRDGWCLRRRDGLGVGLLRLCRRPAYCAGGAGTATPAAAWSLRLRASRSSRRRGSMRCSVLSASLAARTATIASLLRAPARGARLGGHLAICSLRSARKALSPAP